LHHAKRAGNHAGFTADAFLLINLTLSLSWLMAPLGQLRAQAPFTMVAGYGVTFLLVFDNRNTRQKRCGVSTCCSSLCAMTQATSQALHPMHL
jgi:hypothetical protein